MLEGKKMLLAICLVVLGLVVCVVGVIKFLKTEKEEAKIEEIKVEDKAEVKIEDKVDVKGIKIDVKEETVKTEETAVKVEEAKEEAKEVQ